MVNIRDFVEDYIDNCLFCIVYDVCLIMFSIFWDKYIGIVVRYIINFFWEVCVCS